MGSFSLVYFEGKWSEDEAALIEAAAEGAEKAFASGESSNVSAPWVAIAHEAGTSDMYLASRQGRVDVMTAQSPEALAEQIREVETSARPEL